jgi:hypothetical protein
VCTFLNPQVIGSFEEIEALNPMLVYGMRTR